MHSPLNCCCCCCDLVYEAAPEAVLLVEDPAAAGAVPPPEGLMVPMLPHENAPCEGEIRAAAPAVPVAAPPCSTGGWWYPAWVSMLAEALLLLEIPSPSSSPRWCDHKTGFMCIGKKGLYSSPGRRAAKKTEKKQRTTRTTERARILDLGKGSSVCQVKTVHDNRGQ